MMPTESRGWKNEHTLSALASKGLRHSLGRSIDRESNSSSGVIDSEPQETREGSGIARARLGDEIPASLLSCDRSLVEVGDRRGGGGSIGVESG